MFEDIGKAVEGLIRLAMILAIVAPIAVIAAAVFFCLWWFKA